MLFQDNNTKNLLVFATSFAVSEFIHISILNISIFLFCNSIEIMLLSFGIFLFGIKIINEVESLVKRTPESPNLDIARTYVKKACGKMYIAVLLGPPVSLVYGILPIVYLVTGTADYGYFCFIVIFCSHPPMLMITVTLVSRQSDVMKNPSRLHLDNVQKEEVIEFKNHSSPSISE